MSSGLAGTPETKQKPKRSWKYGLKWKGAASEREIIYDFLKPLQYSMIISHNVFVLDSRWILLDPRAPKHFPIDISVNWSGSAYAELTHAGAKQRLKDELRVTEEADRTSSGGAMSKDTGIYAG